MTSLLRFSELLKILRFFQLTNSFLHMRVVLENLRASSGSLRQYHTTSPPGLQKTAAKHTKLTHNGLSWAIHIRGGSIRIFLSCLLPHRPLVAPSGPFARPASCHSVETIFSWLCRVASRGVAGTGESHVASSREFFSGHTKNSFSWATL